MELYEKARNKMNVCKGCKVCNGEACRGLNPGPGGKGSGEGFVRNVKMLKNIGLVYDCIHEDYEVDTSVTLFGRELSAPIFVAPIANVTQHFGTDYNEYSYTSDICEGMKRVNMLPFYGDGVKEEFFDAPMKALSKSGGYGIMTIKPWADEIVMKKLNACIAHHPVAVAMDVDASGLVHLKNTATPIVFKSVNDLKRISSSIDVPFIVKGIMSIEGAQKALEAGAEAIVISNHGGRVLDDCVSGIEVLAGISQYVNGRMKILVDGGIRSGNDIFKALALGADGCLIGRPFVIAAIADGANGVTTLAERYKKELEETMRMCNCQTIKDIKMNKVKIFQK